MTPIREVYPPEFFDGTFYAPSNYEPLLRSMGHELLVKRDEGSYSGDTWLLFKDGKRFGYLLFGWGSCSGCDALQACSSYEEVEALRQSLCRDIRWFDDARAALEWFDAHDWEADVWGDTEGQRAFVEAAKVALSDAQNEQG